MRKIFWVVSRFFEKGRDEGGFPFALQRSDLSTKDVRKKRAVGMINSHHFMMMS